MSDKRKFRIWVVEREYEGKPAPVAGEVLRICLVAESSEHVEAHLNGLAVAGQIIPEHGYAFMPVGNLSGEYSKRLIDTGMMDSGSRVAVLATQRYVPHYVKNEPKPNDTAKIPNIEVRGSPKILKLGD